MYDVAVTFNFLRLQQEWIVMFLLCAPVVMVPFFMWLKSETKYDGIVCDARHNNSKRSRSHRKMQ